MNRTLTFILASLVIFPAVTHAADAAPAAADKPTAKTEETVTIVADKWCPYNCEAGSEHPGFMIEIAQKAFAKHNIKVEYSIEPWTRAIEETREMKHTAIVGAAHKDAPDFVFPEVTQGIMRNSFFVKKGNTWKFNGIDSLAKVSIAVIADYSYNKDLNDYVEKNKNEPKLVQVVSGDNALDTNFTKLLADRVGAVVEGNYVVDYYMSQHHGTSDKVEKAGTLPPSDDDNVFIAFSPKNPKAKTYADILSKETQALRKSGELKKILATYNVTDWQK